jgi:uncharacterized protein YndB with AHSA1/START domain
MTTDRIDKKTLLKAPRGRVWRALTIPSEFGHWFGGRFEASEFKPGVRVRAQHSPTKVDPDVAAKQEEALKDMKDKTWEMTIERVEPERLFSFRWHPFAIDPKVDYSKDPTTLVEFTLEDAPGGTLLTVVESGFDKIPLERRSKAFRANEEGWGLVVRLIDRYVTAA